MVELAAKNGADIVKFQSYFGDQISGDDPEYEWFRKVALPDEKHFEFKRPAESLKAEFSISPFIPSQARFLCEKLGCKFSKVASGYITNFEMLNVINANAAAVRKVYLATGISTLDEIRVALRYLDKVEEVATPLRLPVPLPAGPGKLEMYPDLSEGIPKPSGRLL